MGPETLLLRSRIVQVYTRKSLACCARTNREQCHRPRRPGRQPTSSRSSDRPSLIPCIASRDPMFAPLRQSLRQGQLAQLCRVPTGRTALKAEGDTLDVQSQEPQALLAVSAAIAAAAIAPAAANAAVSRHGHRRRWESRRARRHAEHPQHEPALRSSCEHATSCGLGHRPQRRDVATDIRAVPVRCPAEVRRLRRQRHVHGQPHDLQRELRRPRPRRPSPSRSPPPPRSPRPPPRS